MFRFGISVLIVCVAFHAAKSQDSTTHQPFESYEREGFSFMYDGKTHLMMMLSENKCYIFQLSTAEINSIHTDAGMRDTEMRLLSQVNDAYYTKVPAVILNPSIMNQCMYANRQHATDFFLVH